MYTTNYNNIITELKKINNNDGYNRRKGTRIRSQILFLMEKSILYVKIT